MGLCTPTPFFVVASFFYLTLPLIPVRRHGFFHPVRRMYTTRLHVPRKVEKLTNQNGHYAWLCTQVYLRTRKIPYRLSISRRERRNACCSLNGLRNVFRALFFCLRINSTVPETRSRTGRFFNNFTTVGWTIHEGPADVTGRPKRIGVRASILGSQSLILPPAAVTASVVPALGQSRNE